jgi:AcrR family transcriptional regulator
VGEPARRVEASRGVQPARGVERALARQRRKYEQEVERLVDATFRVMRRRDTADPTVTDILVEAGMSTTAFYRHFPTKDDLLLTLLERAHDVTRAHLDELLAARSEPSDRIVAWVRGMFDLLRTDELVAANRPFLLAHPRLLERFPAEIGAGVDALVEPLARAIAEARAAAGVAPGDAATDARLVHHQVFGMLIDAAALRQTSDPSIVDAVASYTLRATLGTA